MLLMLYVICSKYGLVRDNPLFISEAFVSEEARCDLHLFYLLDSKLRIFRSVSSRWHQSCFWDTCASETVFGSLTFDQNEMERTPESLDDTCHSGSKERFNRCSR